MSKKHHIMHGLSHTREYQCYYSMLNRCYLKSNKHYDIYGGRGIKVKYKDFLDFFNDMGFAPLSIHTIDRIDTNGHYERGNCRWATPKEQARNTRRNRNIDINGVTKTIGDWAGIVGISAKTMKFRIKNWDKELWLTPKHAKGHGVNGINIYFDKKRNRYRARIRYRDKNNKRIEVYIGLFKDFNEAFLKCNNFLYE